MVRKLIIPRLKLFQSLSSHFTRRQSDTFLVLGLLHHQMTLGRVMGPDQILIISQPHLKTQLLAIFILMKYYCMCYHKIQTICTCANVALVKISKDKNLVELSPTTKATPCAGGTWTRCTACGWCLSSGAIPARSRPPSRWVRFAGQTGSRRTRSISGRGQARKSASTPGRRRSLSSPSSSSAS